jgi:hypothetical protein
VSLSLVSLQGLQLQGHLRGYRLLHIYTSCNPILLLVVVQLHPRNVRGSAGRCSDGKLIIASDAGRMASRDESNTPEHPADTPPFSDRWPEYQPCISAQHLNSVGNVLLQVADV